jgi:polar amino acid transport system permease protein
MFFDLTFVLQYWDILFKGFLNTLYVCGIGIALGMLIGAIACAAKLSRFKLFRGWTNAYIEFFRGTPFLIQVYILYYVGPGFGLELSALFVGIIGLGIYGGAYYAEIYRSGILSIPKGQIEAARALGIGDAAILFRIILPQMMGLILAPFTNQTITLIKESAILSVITLQELTFAGQRIIGQTFRYVEVYAMIALLYWALISVFSVISTQLERISTRYLRVKTD